MLLRFESLKPTRLTGLFVENPDFSPEETSALWRGFRGRLDELELEKGASLFSLQIYSGIKAGEIHQRWAAAESPSVLPAGMHQMEIPVGLYAVFLYRGGMAGFEAFLRDAIFQKLPALSLDLDDRPHFQLLGEGFNPFSESSEEEVWIPVRPRFEGLENQL